jgi:hypothetical protein
VFALIIAVLEASKRTAATVIDGAAVHALSNHLAVILGFIELVLAETKPDDPRRADLTEIRDAAVEAAKIIGRPVGESSKHA